MKDAYIAVTRGQGQLLYALARASKAKRLVEFGASFGISAIYLGAAARDNGGRLVTTEIEPNKIEAARANLSAAGLDDVAELRAGDAMETRRTGPHLPHFLLAPPLLARTDLLMTVPRAVLADVAPRFGLVALPCPVKLAPVELSMFWSAQLDRDPAVTWFRQTLLEAADEAFSRSEPLATGQRRKERRRIE